MYSSLMRIRCRVLCDIGCGLQTLASGGPPGSSGAGMPLYGLNAITATQSWETLSKSLASPVVWLRIRRDHKGSRSGWIPTLTLPACMLITFQHYGLPLCGMGVQ